MPRPSVTRIEYKGLSRNQMYTKASKDYSDDGRCWWVERKILESLHQDEPDSWRKKERAKYNAQQRYWRKKRNAEQKSKIEETRKKEAELTP